MRRFDLAVYVALTFGLYPTAHAQSLPDQVGPAFDDHSEIPSEEAITNPSFGSVATDSQKIGPSPTGTTKQEDCHRRKDVRTDRSNSGRGKLDCVR
ncbi:hypothetical protein [Rhizobium grahamii]|uniref:Uncharacterized protein n=1 Tax=Rhizobium grahamii CCGE 502 TaxID=990285 RepID=S3HDW1_9HYPH|nr:hypothetical protein [Rhizobium grahamii]EPE96919.1 hypothetical protein RGCCGE502_18335 [Rhizobium grahamii CCGE 502]